VSDKPINDLPDTSGIEGNLWENPSMERADKSAPLTAEEIAHYTRAHADNEMDSREYRTVLPRLLDEVERWRNPEAIKMWRDENAVTLERVRALLKRIEWSGVYDSGYGDRCHPCCPSCRADSPTDGGGDGKHEPGCELTALIGPPSGVRQG
jgi:hypothetical protein